MLDFLVDRQMRGKHVEGGCPGQAPARSTNGVDSEARVAYCAAKRQCDQHHCSCPCHLCGSTRVHAHKHKREHEARARTHAHAARRVRVCTHTQRWRHDRGRAGKAVLRTNSQNNSRPRGRREKLPRCFLLGAIARRNSLFRENARAPSNH
jgi:hypothetical protein